MNPRDDGSPAGRLRPRIADADSGSAVADSPPIRVIFVCTGNSARSQMAEALLRHDGGARFEVVSAGVNPRGVHPLTIAALGRVGIDISDARSKPVGRFLGQRFDYVITVCDRARASCPVFPGGNETLHWGIDDPVEAEGTEVERMAAFDRALKEIAGRIHAFVPIALARASKMTEPDAAAGKGEAPTASSAERTEPRLELYFLRHADAGDPAAWPGDDADRPLTKEGRRQAEALGEVLKDLGIKPDALLASPKVRAVETAKLVGRSAGAEVEIDQRLAGGLEAKGLAKLIEELDPDVSRVVLVGHDPDFSTLVSWLVGSQISLAKGALARVDLPDRTVGAGRGSLRRLLAPDAKPG